MIVTAMGAREVGDHEWADVAQRTLDQRPSVAESQGARRCADGSGLGIRYANLGRFGRHSALRDLVAFGTTDTWRTGPVLAEAAYPEVQVARAVTDGAALDLAPRPGVARSAPGSASSGSNPIAPEVAGATQPEVIASANGEAQIEIDLGDRHLVRIGPR